MLSTDKVKVTTWSDTQIKVKIPAAAVTGDVTVTNSIGASGPYGLTIDSLLPAITSFMINSNDISTTSPTVSLSMEASDGGTGLAKMQFANSSSGPWSALEDFSTSKAGWILSSGPGTKTVYLKVFDNAGNYAVSSDTISLLPNITSIAPNPASGLSTSASNLVTITGTAFGSSRTSTSFITFPTGLKVLSTDKAKVTTWSDTQIKVKVPAAAITGDVTVTNSIGASGPYGLTIDSLPPAITSFMINSNDISTTSPTVSLSIEASDGGTGLAKMQFANSSSGPWSALEDFSTSKAGWILSSGPGTKTVYLKVFDNAGNYAVSSDTISLLPNITSIAPNPASGLSTSASNLVTITGTAFGSSRASTSFITFPKG